MIIRKRSVVSQKQSQITWYILTFLRYSEFDDLRKKLLMTFPNADGAIPPLPPKSFLCTFNRSGLRQV